MELNKIYNQDCIEYMKTLPNGCVDLIVADVPYNIGKDYGNNSDKQTHNDYMINLKKWIGEFNRILTDNGTLFLYTGKQYYPYYYIEVNKYMSIQNSIIWNYDSSGVQAKAKYGSLYEPLIWATKHKKNYIFNKKFAMVEAKTGAKRKLIDYRKTPPQPYNTQKIDGDVWNYTRVRYRMPEYTKHPTQKPLSICDRIITVHSNKNDVVYIPFAGSGSEIVSCIKNNRNYIATEINKEYIDEIINKRIENTYKELNKEAC